jgi:mRNA interferase HigB
MRVVGRDKLMLAEKAHPGSGLGKALAAWVKVVEGSNWRYFPDVKNTLSGVEYVKPYVIFKIKKNEFRLTARINYQAQTVMVLRVKTHQDYTREGP